MGPSLISSLPLWAILIPLLGALALLGARRSPWREGLTLASLALPLLLLVRLIPEVLQAPVGMDLPNFLSLGLRFRADELSLLFALLNGLVWTLAGLYATAYMAHESSKTRFYIFFLLTYAGSLGVVLTGDFFSLLLFFELMTFAAYPLVNHKESPESALAGGYYLYLGVFGGLALVAANFLLFFYVGNTAMDRILPLMQELGSARYWITGLFLTGFGIKAGLVPLHIWLPKAHPVAPSPASAILSGLVIKGGIYGIIRTVTSLGVGPSLEYASHLGLFLGFMGLATMFFGSFIGVFESKAKRVLAYSSVSQVGYIMTGLGFGAYLGARGVMGTMGGIYHITNHALFKATLFMSIGYVYHLTHDQEITRLGGLWRRLPITFIAATVAVAGLVGLPFFNGFASKSMIHHAITDAYAYSSLSSLYWGEKVFKLAAIGTMAYGIKLIYYIFLAPPKQDWSHLPREERRVQGVFIGLIAAMLFIGLRPHIAFDHLITPTASALPIDLSYLTYKMGKFRFWNPEDLISALQILGLGSLLFLAIYRFKLNQVRFPRWASLDTLFFTPLCWGSARFCYLLSDQFEGRLALEKGRSERLSQVSLDLLRRLGSFDHFLAMDEPGLLSQASSQVLERLNQLEHSISLDDQRSLRLRDASVNLLNRLNRLEEDMARNERNLEEKIVQTARSLTTASEEEAMKSWKVPNPLPGLARRPVRWSLLNLNFDMIILAVVLLVSLVILLTYTRL